MLEHNNIGIMLSGGIDSATLLWCTVKIIKERGLTNNITVYTSPRPDNSLAFAPLVREHVEQEFDVKIKHKMRGSGDVHHSEQVWSAMVTAMRDCDIVLTAETAQPEHMASDHFERKHVDDEKAYQPFFNLTKDFTVGLAIEQNLTYIMENTHSCTETPDIRCGVCWWCEERKWAFSQQNYTDPGIY